MSEIIISNISNLSSSKLKYKNTKYESKNQFKKAKKYYFLASSLLLSIESKVGKPFGSAILSRSSTIIFSASATFKTMLCYRAL